MTGSPHIVSDVMTQAVVSVDRDTPFKEIVRILQQHRISAVPVVASNGTVAGVVSEADLLPKEEFRDSDPSRLAQLRRLDDLVKAGSVDAAQLMTTPAVTVEASDTLSRAARIMARTKVKRLPVIGPDDRLCGIVSRGDLLKVFLRDDEEIAEEVRREIVAYLFPGEPPPLQVAVAEGAVTLTGRVSGTSRVPVAARLVRSVEGVVDVTWNLGRPLPRPAEPPVMGPLY
ncbi:CBS domain-containing protein [Streptomyces sp. NPDC051976]|uniref:CBS domain-containing protein n=1 Tax=Streptomyces sp. NPDC051976 TaxID=3154947 RepID=UPI00342BAB01